MNPPGRIFLNFANNCIYACCSVQFHNKKWGPLSSFLSYNHLKVKLGGLNRSNCCYGNPLYGADNHNLFTGINACFGIIFVTSTDKEW